MNLRDYIVNNGSVQLMTLPVPQNWIDDGFPHVYASILTTHDSSGIITNFEILNSYDTIYDALQGHAAEKKKYSNF